MPPWAAISPHGVSPIRVDWVESDFIRGKFFRLNLGKDGILSRKVNFKDWHPKCRHLKSRPGRIKPLPPAKSSISGFCFLNRSKKAMGNWFDEGFGTELSAPRPPPRGWWPPRGRHPRFPRCHQCRPQLSCSVTRHSTPLCCG